MKTTKLFAALLVMAGTTFAYAADEVADCGPCKPCKPRCETPCQPSNPCNACPTCVPDCCVDAVTGETRSMTPAEQAMKQEMKRQGRYRSNNAQY